jgi:hypothetical protein
MLFAISFCSCNRVGKRTAWIQIRLRGCVGWSGSMLVANASCWFCRDAAHIFVLFQYLVIRHHLILPQNQADSQVIKTLLRQRESTIVIQIKDLLNHRFMIHRMFSPLLTSIVTRFHMIQGLSLDEGKAATLV